MPHRFLVKDIAFQAGLSTATVDRVLHGRIGVRGQTAARIATAIKELERQEDDRARGGRTLAVDVVVEAPDRFSNQIRAAFERDSRALHPCIFRPRFQMAERIEAAMFARHLDRIGSRGSDAVIVKGPDVPAVRDAVNRLSDAGIPVITLVTDLTGTKRLSYAGIDNVSAGKTAAWLMGKTLGRTPATALVTLSSNSFRGEQDRVSAFAAELAIHHPSIKTVTISEGYGRDDSTGRLAATALSHNPDICAVYSAGGGNRALLQAFRDAGRLCDVYVAHDLDPDNQALLASRHIDFVLHHDLGHDVRAIYALLAKSGYHQSHIHSPMTVHTPHNPGL